MNQQTPIRCIAIDDEAPGLKVIERYCKKIPYLQLEQSFQNPIASIEYIEEHHPDLLFLDINMPDLTGLQLVQLLQHQPAVIFTTAHRDYAPESYEVNAIDYLLKPIMFDRFLKATQKVKDILANSSPPSTSHPIIQSTHHPITPSSSHPGFIFIKSDSRHIKVDLSEILYIEGMRDYVAIHTTTHPHPIMTLSGIEKMLQRLPASDFMRVHRSYIVSLRHISLVQYNHIHIGKQEIPVSGSYKEAVLARISKD